MTDNFTFVPQGYPLWAITDQAFDSLSRFRDADDFAEYMADATLGGPFLVVAWECSAGTSPRPVLAGQSPPVNVVIFEATRDAATGAAVEAFRTWEREKAAGNAARLPGSNRVPQ